MMEQIQPYLISSALFSLLFLVATILFCQYKKSKHSFAKEKFQRLKKVPWDTVIKGLAAAGFILFSRKLIYYLPFDGVIQTKFSIWWVEDNVLTSLFFIFGFFLILVTLIGIVKRYIQIPLKRVNVVFIMLSGVLLFLGIKVIVPLLEGSKVIYAVGIIYRVGLNLIIFAPLLLLKMLCTGKYLGLFTSFVVGYFIVNRYKKLTPKINPGNVKFLIAPGAMLLVFLFLCFSIFPGSWNVKFNDKVKSATSERDMMALLDAVHSINKEKARYESLKPIVSSMVKEEDFRWKKEIYQRVIDEVKTLAGYRSSRLLRKIVLWIAKTGNIPWATAIAEKIPDMEIKDNTLKELRENIEEK
jgi:hypothetical protein